MKYRVFNLLLSLCFAVGVYFLFMYLSSAALPDHDKLQVINGSVTNILRTNSNGIRQQYLNAIHQAATFSFFAFLISIFSIEYIRSGFNLKIKTMSDNLAIALKKLQAKKDNIDPEKEKLISERLKQ